MIEEPVRRRAYPPGGPPVLTTARLRLRPWRAEDAPRVAELAAPFEVVEFTAGLPHPYEVEAARESLAQAEAAWCAGEAARWAIDEPARGGAPLIGAISARLDERIDQADLGYWLGRDGWGRGVATEAGRAVVAWAFDTWGANRVQAHHIARNHSSGRVLEKLGMQREGCLRQGHRRWGRFEDVVLYAALRDDR